MKLCQIWTCCSWYKYKSKKKSWWQKTKKNYFAECQGLALGKVNILPSASPRHSAKPGQDFFLIFYFAECQIGGTRQNTFFAECPGSGTRQRGLKYKKNRTHAHTPRTHHTRTHTHTCAPAPPPRRSRCAAAAGAAAPQPPAPRAPAPPAPRPARPRASAQRPPRPCARAPAVGRRRR